MLLYFLKEMERFLKLWLNCNLNKNYDLAVNLYKVALELQSNNLKVSCTFPKLSSWRKTRISAKCCSYVCSRYTQMKLGLNSILLIVCTLMHQMYFHETNDECCRPPKQSLIWSRRTECSLKYFRWMKNMEACSTLYFNQDMQLMKNRDKPKLKYLKLLTKRWATSSSFFKIQSTI